MTQDLSYLADSVLLTRLSRGEVIAFGTLYERYLDRIYRHVFYRVRDHEEAEDITEMVFLKAWQALTIRPEKSSIQNFRAWLYRIAHNEIVEYHRNHKPSLDIDHAINISDSDQSPEADVQEVQVSQQLAQAIAQLEPNLQQVLVCRFIDRLSHAETADVMKLKPGHVRVLQYRALRRMKEILSRH